MPVRAACREASAAGGLTCGSEILGLLLRVGECGLCLRADALGAVGQLLRLGGRGFQFALLVSLNPVFGFSCPQSIHVCASGEIEAGQYLLDQLCLLDRGQRQGVL